MVCYYRRNFGGDLSTDRTLTWFMTFPAGGDPAGSRRRSADPGGSGDPDRRRADHHLPAGPAAAGPASPDPDDPDTGAKR